jgi:hypothetical protein
MREKKSTLIVLYFITMALMFGVTIVGPMVGGTISKQLSTNPEDMACVIVGWTCHDLFDQTVKGRDAIGGFATSKNSGVVNIQSGDIGPGAATEVLMFDAHWRAWPATLGGVLAAACLDTGFFIGGDHELVAAYRSPLPLARTEVQHPAGLISELRGTWKDPTAVIPGTDSIFM